MAEYLLDNPFIQIIAIVLSIVIVALIALNNLQFS